MAPNHNDAIGYPFSDTNRCSSRIFNKNLMKFDVSTVNDKIGFMRALNLVCVNNSKEFQSKLNWEAVTPGITLPVKECSVVLSSVSRNACGELLNNQTDLVNHTNFYRKQSIERCKSTNIFQKQTFRKTSCAQFIDADVSKNIEQIESEKSNARKRKSNNGVALKVTLKIGNEVISRKYCKKKYLDKENSNTQLSNRIHHHTNCEKCNDIKNSLRNSKTSSNAATFDQVCVKKTDAESLVQTESKQKLALAAALVQLELQRHCLQSKTVKNNEQNNDKAKNIYNNNIGEREDSATSEESEMMSLNAFIEDDVQEILQQNLKKTYNNGNNTFQQNRLSSNKNYEIITIDDDVSDDSVDDCVIIDEYLSHDCLKDKENLNVTKTLELVSKTHTIVEIKKRFHFVDGRITKRQKFRHLDSEIFVKDKKTCPSSQLSLDKSYEKCSLSLKQFVCH